MMLCGEMDKGFNNIEVEKCRERVALRRDNSALDSTNSVLRELSVEFDNYLRDKKGYFRTLAHEVNSIIRIDRNALFEINFYQNEMIETVVGILKVIANIHQIREGTIIAFNNI